MSLCVNKLKDTTLCKHDDNFGRLLNLLLPAIITCKTSKYTAAVHKTALTSAVKPDGSIYNASIVTFCSVIEVIGMTREE